MTEDEKGYNGWANYETWLVNLWLTNDMGGCDAVETMSREAKDKYALAHDIKDYVGDDMPELGVNMWADLLNAAFGEVDWYELAEHYWADFREVD